MRLSIPLFLGLFLSTLGFSSKAHASWQNIKNTKYEKTWHFQSSEMRDAYLNLYTENASWNLVLIEVADDGFQDIVKKEAFQSLEQALSYVNEAQLTYEPQISRAMPLMANPPLWRVTNQWNLDWEKKYSDWVRTQTDPEFFVRYKVATDCADVPMYLRWIFARANGLPVANRLMGSSQIITQDSVRNEWMKYSTAKNWWEDRRFRVAADYFTASSNTHTMVADSYPVAVTREAFTEGVYHIALHGNSGHTQFVHRVFPTATEGALPFYVMASNMPRIIRTLNEGPFWDSQQPELGQGFIRHRWPVKVSGKWTLVAPKQMPYYSEEQYQPGFITHNTYSISVMMKLRPDLNLSDALHGVISSLKTRITERIKLVEEGFKFCSKSNCAPGTAAYEDWSTPSRDARIRETSYQVSQILQIAQQLNLDLEPQWQKALEQEVLNLDGQAYALKQVLAVWDGKIYSYDPRVPIANRWGLAPEAAGTNIGVQVIEALTKRSEKIKSQGNACRTNCAPGSDAYKKWNTIELDANLIGAPLAISSYCQNFSKESCQKLNEKVATYSFNYDREKMTVPEILQFAFFMISDPRAPQSVRWMGHQELLDITTLPYITMEMKSTGWTLATVGDGLPFLIHAKTGQKIEDSERMWVHLSEDGKWAFGFHLLTKAPWALNLATGAKSQIANFDLETMTFNVVSSKRILFSSNSNLIVYELNEAVQQWQQAAHWQNLPFLLMGDEKEGLVGGHGRKRNGFSKAEMILISKENQTYLVDLSRSVEMVLLPSVNFPKSISRKTSAPEAIVFQSIYADGGKDSVAHYIYDRKTKKVREMNVRSSRSLRFSNNQKWAIVEDGEESFSIRPVDKNWNIGAAKVTGKQIRFDNESALVIESAASFKLYSIQNYELELIKIPAGYLGLSKNGPYLVAKRGGMASPDTCLFEESRLLFCANFISTFKVGQEYFFMTWNGSVAVYSPRIGFNYPMMSYMYDFKDIPMGLFNNFEKPSFGGVFGTETHIMQWK